MEIIIVAYVQDYIYRQTKGKYEGKFLVHLAGVSDKPSKLMKLQVWEMPFSTVEEAKKTLDQYKDNIKKLGSFIIIHGAKK